MGFILWDDLVEKKFKEDKELARLCLNSAIEQWQTTGDARLLVTRLKQLSRAYGVLKLARDSKLGIRTLENCLSDKGNPTLKTLSIILKTLNDYCEEGGE